MGKPEIIKRNAVIACKDSRFVQTVPRNQNMRLMVGNNHNHQLLWVDGATGQQYLVPNIWYNQPVEWRIKAMDFTHERLCEQAKRIRRGKEHGWEREEQRVIEQANRTLGIKKKMEATGEVIA